MALYETLRAAVIEGRARPEGMALLRFHGMAQGLMTLLRTDPTPSASVPAPLPLPRDSAFVRLLANLVLHTHSELTHVC